MEPRMAAASAGEARAAFLSLAEAGPKNGVGATEEQVYISARALLLFLVGMRLLAPSPF
jgi:hypothetical protein